MMIHVSGMQISLRERPICRTAIRRAIGRQSRSAGRRAAQAAVRGARPGRDDIVAAGPALTPLDFAAHRGLPMSGVCALSSCSGNEEMTRSLGRIYADGRHWSEGLNAGERLPASPRIDNVGAGASSGMKGELI
jgi:hypothetical protein